MAFQPRVRRLLVELRQLQGRAAHHDRAQEAGRRAGARNPSPRGRRLPRLGPLHRALRPSQARRRHGAQRDEEGPRGLRGQRGRSRERAGDGVAERRVAHGLRRILARRRPVHELHHAPGEDDPHARHRRHARQHGRERRGHARRKRAAGRLGPDRLARRRDPRGRGAAFDAAPLHRGAVPREAARGRLRLRPHAQADPEGDLRDGSCRDVRRLHRRPGRAGGGNGVET